MKKNRHLILYPVVVHQNDILSIKIDKESFPLSEYSIINPDGRIFRKGKITSKIVELKLRLVGLNSGNYVFKMGDCEESFEIV